MAGLGPITVSQSTTNWDKIQKHKNIREYRRRRQQLSKSRNENLRVKDWGGRGKVWSKRESGQGKPGQDDRGPKLGEAEVMKWNGKT